MPRFFTQIAFDEMVQWVKVPSTKGVRLILISGLEWYEEKIYSLKEVLDLHTCIMTHCSHSANKYM